MQKGFTLVELLITISILGILSAVAIPTYQGYILEANSTVARNNIRAIYLQEMEWMSDNGVYYTTGCAVGVDNSAIINTNLFDGDQILDNDIFSYCIQGANQDFTAIATLISDNTITYSINQNNLTQNSCLRFETFPCLGFGLCYFF